ncbi:hypothetical protein GGR07_001943 [Bacteroides pyogenes]|nr:hypothetical protein [Bacteroides pyogenes]
MKQLKDEAVLLFEIRWNKGAGRIKRRLSVMKQLKDEAVLLCGIR